MLMCCGTAFSEKSLPRTSVTDSVAISEKSLPRASEPDTIPEDVTDIEELVVTSRRTPGKISATAPVQTLSAADISKLGIQNMADAVRRFAGTNVKDYGGVGGLKTVSVRNMGAAHTAVSYDGSPVSNCQAGQIDIGRFSLDNVGMLSLSVGQSDDMLQPAKLYASAAVLGIWTEKPHFDYDNPYAFRVQIKGGSFGYVSPSVRWWQKIGSRVTTSLDATYLRSDGNYPFKLVNGKLVTKERRNNSEIDSWHAEGNVYYNMPDGGELQVKGYYFYSKRGLPGAITLYNPVSTEKLWDENAFILARYKKKFNPKWSLQAQAKYNYAWNKDEETGPQFDGGIYSATHHQDEWYVSATGMYQPISGLSIALAEDGAINKLNSTMYECPYPTRYSSITALSARWNMPHLTVSGSLVGTLITEKVKIGDPPKDISKLNPSLSFSVQPWQDHLFYLRAMYKSTFRVPTFNDLYYYRLGSRTLRPEKANEFDVGITWGNSLFPAMDYLSFTLDAYYNDVDDKIVAFPTTYAWRMVNFGKVRVTGLDMTLATAFTITNGIDLVLSGAYTWQKAIDITDKNSKTYKDQLPYTPEHSGNVSAIVETPWVNVGYSIVFVGKRYYLDQNIPINEIAAYDDHTLTVSHDFNLKKCKLSVRAEILNLTNKQYDVIKFYPMPGRSWRLTGVINF